jgi:hypothetical protein
MDYGTMVQAILTVHRGAVGRAAGAVNQALLFRNWLIGAYVVEYEQCGEDRAACGARLLANLAGDLRRREVAGCSAEMLGRMRSFYRALPQLRTRGFPQCLSDVRRLLHFGGMKIRGCRHHVSKMDAARQIVSALSQFVGVG